MIAAYGVVIGALLAYGLWVRAQRRALGREIGASDGASKPPGTG